MASTTDGIRRMRPAERGAQPIRKHPPQLSDILRPERSSPIDMTRLERKKRHPRRTLFVILSVGAGLLIVAAAGFYFFLSRDKEYTGSSIAVSHEVPVRIAAGDDFPLEITITNTDAVALNDVLLAIQFPNGYTIKNASRSAENEAKNAYQVGTLDPAEKVTLTITGNLLGAVGDEKTFGLAFTFRPENFNYQFYETEQLSVRIAASVLTMDIDGPQEIAPETEGTWTIRLTNVSSDPLTSVRISLTKPEGFTLIASDPALSDDLRWSIDRLDPDGEKTLTFSGRFVQTDQEFVEFTFTSAISHNGTEDIQGTASLLILLVKPDLALTLDRLGAEMSAAAQPGDRIALTLSYENRSELALSDVGLTLKIDDASPIDESSIEAAPSASREGRTMTWNKEKVPALGQLKPGAKGSVDITVSVVETLLPESDDDVNPNVTLHASSRIGAVSDLTNSAAAGEERTVTIPVATELTVSGEARYYDAEGFPIGTGPIPPQVGKTTTYVIEWFVNNTTSDVKDFVVTATLPPDVFWPGEDFRSDAGELRFNPETREVRWTMNTVPAGSGSLSETLSARFTVRITPSETDVGSTPILVDTAQVSGTDSHTNTAVGGSIETMTTELIHDSRGIGNGVVVPAE